MNGYDEEPWERAWWENRASICTCGAWRMPYRWCDDGCAFVTPPPEGERAIGNICACGHLVIDHDADDGCGACALAMVGPCRVFRLQATKGAL